MKKFIILSRAQTSLYENPNHKQPELTTMPYLLHLCGKSEVILQQLVPVMLDLRELIVDGPMSDKYSSQFLLVFR